MNHPSMGYFINASVQVKVDLPKWPHQGDKKKNSRRSNFNQMTQGKTFLRLKENFHRERPAGTVNAKHDFAGKTMLKLKPKNPNPEKLDTESKGNTPEIDSQECNEEQMTTEKILLPLKEPQQRKIMNYFMPTKQGKTSFGHTGPEHINFGKAFLDRRESRGTKHFVEQKVDAKQQLTPVDAMFGNGDGFALPEQTMHKIELQAKLLYERRQNKIDPLSTYATITKRSVVPQPSPNPSFLTPTRTRQAFAGNHIEGWPDQHIFERRGCKISALTLLQTPNRPCMPYAGRNSPHSPIVKARFSPQFVRAQQSSSPSWLLAQNVAEAMGESVLTAEQYADLYEQKKQEYTSLVKEGQRVFEKSDADADGLAPLRTVVYEAGLLLRGKMYQFEDLLNRYFRPIEKDPQPVIINDLAGWWDLLELVFKKIDQRIPEAKEVIKTRMNSNNNDEALNETRNSQHRKSITELNAESRAFNERIKQKIDYAYKLLESLNDF